MLAAARGDRLEALYVLAVHTGMKSGELLWFERADVDLESRTIRVRRTPTRTEDGRVMLVHPLDSDQSYP